MRDPDTQPKFSIIVIGAGICGCASALGLARRGHRVCVLEARPALSELGAGLQISPNGSRILCAWGLRARFEEFVCQPPWVQYRTYDAGETLGKHPRNINSWYEDIYGSPLWTIYRPHYQQLLAESAVSHGAELVFSAKAVKVDADTGTVYTTDGRCFKADLIVGADGIWSKARAGIASCRDIVPIVWDEYAYRCLADRDHMLTAPPTAALSNNGDTNFFLGPSGILLCYPCNQGKSFNIVAPCHRPVNKEAHDTFNPEVDPVELVDAYKDFFSPVPELLSSIKKCVKWTIVYLPDLPTYSSENGRIVLLGDAAHAMLPAAASASNMAVEDAAALCECISACKDVSELKSAVKAYEAIRKRRNDRVWEISMISQRNVSSYTAKSYNDAVAARNEGLRKATEELAEYLKLSSEDRKALQASQVGDEAAIYPSPALLKWLYGYDTITVSREYLRDNPLSQ
ncbi:MAG: hypothetical protein Q9157_000374 [Trypethelium eluteriae]